MKEVLMKKIVLVIMVILGLVIVISNIGVTYFILTSATIYSVEKSIEGTIITNGLTIISLAITVWLGISIYNAIGKNEIAELKSALEKYSPLSEQVRGYTKQQLVNQMYKTGDISCDYIAKCFDKDTDIPVERYADLLTIDILLQKAHDARDLSEKAQRSKWSYTGIEKINRYKGKFKKRYKLEDSYLNYREADFWFYIGACCQDDKRYDAYKRAKNLFVNSLNDFGISLPLDQELSMMMDEESLRLSVYFANAIGQCLANMENQQSTEETEPNNLRSEARKYLEFAVKYSRISGEREVYYRNYGCFIENMAESIKDLEEAYGQYKKAFYVSSDESNTYYVLISNLNKRIRTMLGIEERTPKTNRKEALYVMSFAEVEDKEKIVELIEEMEAFINLATRVIPNNASWYAFSVYRKLYKLCVRDHLGSSQSKKYLHAMKQDVAKIKLLNGQSALCIVAQMEVNDIENYLSIV